MKKAEANEIAGKILDLRRAARVGAGPMVDGVAAREQATSLVESIPARARQYIGMWFWKAISAE